MSSLLSRVVLTMAAVVLASTSFALAETKATPAPKLTVAQETTPAATPTPNPFTYRGTLRAYDFTRQNAYNYPGVQWNPAKYNSNAVNQASFVLGRTSRGLSFRRQRMVHRRRIFLR